MKDWFAVCAVALVIIVGGAAGLSGTAAFLLAFGATWYLLSARELGFAKARDALGIRLLPPVFQAGNWRWIKRLFDDPDRLLKSATIALGVVGLGLMFDADIVYGAAVVIAGFYVSEIARGRTDPPRAVRIPHAPPQALSVARPTIETKPVAAPAASEPKTVAPPEPKIVAPPEPRTAVSPEPKAPAPAAPKAAAPAAVSRTEPTTIAPAPLKPAVPAEPKTVAPAATPATPKTVAPAAAPTPAAPAAPKTVAPAAPKTVAPVAAAPAVEPKTVAPAAAPTPPKAFAPAAAAPKAAAAVAPTVVVSAPAAAPPIAAVSAPPQMISVAPEPFRARERIVRKPIGLRKARPITRNDRQKIAVQGKRTRRKTMQRPALPQWPSRKPGFPIARRLGKPRPLRPVQRKPAMRKRPRG